MESPVDKTQSPLVDVISGDFAYFIRMCYTDEFYTKEEMNSWTNCDGNPIRKRQIKIVKLHKEDNTQCYPLSSIEDTETLLFDKAYSGE